jgi:hypothetical protein
MNLSVRLLAGAALCAGVALAADPAPAPFANMIDGPIRTIERELVPLVEAMPDDKMNFAPAASMGAFEKVRTFAQQAKHIAYVNYAVASSALGEKNPSASGPDENGPADLTTKEQIVKYVKDSFAYAHKAAQAVTAQNAGDQMISPFDPSGKEKMARLAAINVVGWHSFDHYGQMAVYARMNGIIPPASRQ